MPDVALFGALDWVMFGGMLVISLGIGVYHGCRGNETSEDFLMGGRSMSWLPVAISLLSSFISAISLLGLSGEAYGHGLEMSLNLFGSIFGILFSCTVCLPVFYPLKMTSINEYIELRFKSPGLRKVAMLFTSIQNMMYLGVCLYAPTIALSTVTPLDTTTNILIVGIVVTIYSTIGGLKAVVWTDVFQMGVIIVGIFSIITVGTVEAGGPARVWALAKERGRLNVSMEVDFYQRHNLFNLILMGSIAYSSMYGTSQLNLQRCCSVPTIAKARKVMYVNMVGMGFLNMIAFLSGLCAFAAYADCDPLKEGHIASKDGILPYFVMDRMRFLYGVPGLFVAAIFSGALSSLSSVINAQVAMLWADVLKDLRCFKNISSRAATYVNKIASMLVGVIMICMAFLASNTEGIMQTAMSVFSVSTGPMFGIFLMGVLCPHIGKRGAWAGFVMSWLITAWIVTGNFVFNPKPELLPLSTAKCDVNLTKPSNAVYLYATSLDTILIDDHLQEIQNNMNFSKDIFNQSSLLFEDKSLFSSTFAPMKMYPRSAEQNCNATQKEEWGMMKVYGLSYCLFPVIGFILCIFIALLTTLAAGFEDPHSVPPELLLPAIRRHLEASKPKKTLENFPLMTKTPDDFHPMPPYTEISSHSSFREHTSKV